MRTREDIEATGFEPICDLELGQPPECEHHDHVPGKPLEEPRGIPDVTLPDIPIERVQEALKALLDIDDLRGVISAEIAPGYVSAVVLATDSRGFRFLGADGRPARHTITRKVLR